jgi:ABC-type transport system involved in multi-copper enzyme maturation permease subunit
MRRILAITKNTFREAIRDRILYGILAFAILFIAATIILSSLSLGEDIKIVRDFGLAGIYLFGLIITVFVGASVMYREINNRTLYLVLSKPVSVAEVVVGKFLGLLAGAGLAVGFMVVVYLAVVWFKGGGFDYISLVAVGLQFGEMSIFIAVAICFSLLSTPLTAVLYSVCIAYIGHSLDLLLKVANSAESAPVRWVAWVVYYVFPNLEKFNIRDLVIYQKTIPVDAFLIAMAYAGFYTVLLLYFSVLILRNKEL